jgi:N-acetylglucosaminyl-diphospho-decaprenol L-rhamnosyltransferase
MTRGAARNGAPFSIVVVTWNVAGELAELLDTISTHLAEPFEIVVVDNASSDRTPAVAKAWKGPLRLIGLEENVGFGAANNHGVRAARYDVVVMLNPDTLLVDGSIRDLAQLAQETGALVGPRVLNDDGSVQPSASPLPGGWEQVIAALVPTRLLPRPLAVVCSPWRSGERREVAWLTGCCIAGRKALLLELGPFDEGIHLYCEDLDLGLRARERGTPSLFAPETARLIHLGDRSAAQRFADSGLAETVRNRRLIVRRHVGARREWFDFLSQVAGNAGRLAVKRLLGRETTRERAWLGTAGRQLR